VAVTDQNKLHFALSCLTNWVTSRALSSAEMRSDESDETSDTNRGSSGSHRVVGESPLVLRFLRPLGRPTTTTTTSTEVLLRGDTGGGVGGRVPWWL